MDKQAGPVSVKLITEHAQNIEDGVSEEAQYIKSILMAIEVLAGQQYEPRVIVNLVRCARWVAPSMEDNVACTVERIMVASREVH